jgi:outer membrane protein TolC
LTLLIGFEVNAQTVPDSALTTKSTQTPGNEKSNLRLPSVSALNQQGFLQLLVARSAEIKFSQISTEVTRNLQQAEGALYESILFSSLRQEGRSRQRTADERLQNTFTAGTAVLDENGHTDELGIRSKLPTGAEVSASYKLTRKSNNIIPQTAAFDTEYNALLNLTLKQPLLRNLGREVTETDLRVAEIEHQISLHQLTQQTLKTSIEGLTLYWQLHRAQESVALRQQALSNARNLLADAEARLAAGKATASSLLELQSVLLNRQIEHARSQQALREAQSKLGTALDLTTQESMAIVTKPTLRDSTVDVSMVDTERALDQWSPYQIARLKFDQAQARLKFAHNQTKPVADLVLSYSGTGYDNKSQAARSAAEQSAYPEWFLGLNFEFPLQGNRKARQQYLAQINRLAQAELDIAAIKNSFTNDIAVRLDDVITAYKELMLSYDELTLRQRILDIEEQRAKLGMGSQSTLIQRYADLVEAQQRQLENQVRYELAVATLQYIKGNLLSEHQIVISIQATRGLETLR